MKLIICIDNHGGMLFNRRRQSQDRAVRADMLREVQGSALWMNAYSAGQFSGGGFCTDEAFLDKAQPTDFCFVENVSVRPYLERVTALILYRWNRDYPADFYLDFEPEADGFQCVRAEEFPGFSHENITKEVWIR